MRQAIEDYDKNRAALPTKAAAQGWLSLVDRYFAFLDAGGSQIAMQNQSGTAQQAAPTFQDLILALPPPDSWAQIVTEVDARPIPIFSYKPIRKGSRSEGYPRPVVFKSVRLVALRLTVHTLTHRAETQWQDFDSLRRINALVKAEKTTNKDAVDSSTMDQISASFAGLIEALLKTAPDSKHALAMIALELDLQEAANSSGQQSRFGQNGQVGVLSLPDLVPLVGERAAAVLIKKAVDQTGLVRVEKGAATARLACRIATAEISRLKTPQWALVSGLDPDSIALMGALRTRFAVFEPENNENQNYQLIEAKKAAIGYYLYGLCAEGKTDEAVKLAALLPSPESGITGTPLAAAKDAGLYAVVYQFLSRVVSTTSDYDLYDNLLEIAPHLNKSGETLNLIHEALGRPDLSASKRSSLEKSLTNALLAGDRVDEAVEAIRALLKKDKSSLENRRAGMTGAEIETARAEILEQSTKLASLGTLLGHDDWIDEGTQAATDVMRAEASLQSVSAPNANSANAIVSEPLSDSLYFTAIELANTLQQRGRISAAEQILSLGLRGAASRDAVDAENRKRQQNGFDPSVLQPQLSVTTESAYLSALVLLYNRVGRTADVLALLDTAPDWGASDLVDVTVLEDGKNTSLGVAAAEALLAAGRTEDSRRVVMAFLKRDRGNDALYALLLKIEGPEHVLPKLDLLAKQDRFEERPLIWRAEALLQLGRLPDAETAARAAIAVDPSDGEEPHGDRMRGYEVLSKIRAARGDQTESAFFGNVVTAIRTAEHADDLYQAGLISRAIALYKEALTHFADAYCIQSRLAVDLAAAGKLDEAAAHYRRAYELMPGSFGRMESHCFGCEGAFRGPTPQKIAEQVFVSLIAKEPKKPQVHYLLGYLREEENRPAEALTEFRRAADLDPDYINAWRHISELSTDEVPTDPSRDTAALNLLRLDPGQQHIMIDFASLSDLSGLYTLVSRLKNDDLLATKDSTSLSPFARNFGSPYPPHESVYGLSATRAKMDRDKAEMLATLRKQGNPDPEQYLEEMRGNASEAYAEANGPVTSPTGAVSRNAVLALVPSLLDQTTIPPVQ